ncbi:putative ABC transport system permease protein [Deinococcus metalli]|uniref:ABC transporter permease n=1 Tax=Deinococcus metalli TaxID=1141878 RepID=A0A7W8NPE3_9DEIO|nr:ABC transporter permease [Deinococcus metalli]MBB5375665.1 putative ABC transport system permease protein [Deinococcus metalli]GHF37955.1 ABC transporter permease [Deinococcus metalli]
MTTTSTERAPAAPPATAPRRQGGGIGLGGAFTIAWRAIIGTPMRSILTALGVIIGVAAVVALTAIGQGSTAGVTRNLESLGTNLLTVGSARGFGGGSLVRGGPRQTVTVKDAETLATTFGARVAGVAPAAQGSVQAKLGSNNTQATVVGTWPAYETVRNSPVETGAYFTQADVDGKKRVAVIGHQVLLDLWGDGTDGSATDDQAIGQRIRLGTVTFTVSGVLPDKGNSGFGNANGQILIPLSTYLQRFSRTNSASGEPTVNNVYLQATDARDLKQLQSDVTDVMMTRHKLTDPTALDFQVQNQADSLASLSAITNTLTILVGAIAGISLLVGGIGIMNIMLVSVTERTREIGVRKALGARPRDILTQFLVEASLLSVSGGVIGMLLGVAAAFAGRAFSITPVFSPTPMIVAFVFSALVGVFFGYYPAARAARLDPVDSLRYE